MTYPALPGSSPPLHAFSIYSTAVNGSKWTAHWPAMALWGIVDPPIGVLFPWSEPFVGLAIKSVCDLFEIDSPAPSYAADLIARMYLEYPAGTVGIADYVVPDGSLATLSVTGADGLPARGPANRGVWPYGTVKALAGLDPTGHLAEIRDSIKASTIQEIPAPFDSNFDRYWDQQAWLNV